MSAGIHHFSEINKFQDTSFVEGKEGYNALMDYLWTSKKSEIEKERDVLLENSIYSLGEVSNVLTRLKEFVGELGKKNELTAKEKAVKKTADQFAKFLEGDFLSARDQKIEGIIGDLTFGDFTQTYLTKGTLIKSKTDANRLPPAFKLQVISTKSLIESIVSKEPATIATQTFWRGYQKGENFDSFTSIFLTGPKLFAIAMAKFREDGSVEQVNNLKLLLSVYKVAFNKIGAGIIPDENQRKAVLAGIEVMENVINFDPKEGSKTIYDAVSGASSLSTSENDLLEALILKGPDSIGTKEKKSWVKGADYAKLAMLLFTPNGFQAISDRIDNSNEKEIEVLKHLFGRFHAVFDSLDDKKPRSAKAMNYVNSRLTEVFKLLGEDVDLPMFNDPVPDDVQ